MAGKKANSKEPQAEIEEVVEETVTAPSDPAPAKPAGPRMYVGPTIAKFGLVQNVNYEEIPGGAQKLFEACPRGKLLFIPVERYPEAERQIREQNGYFWDAYKAALDARR